MYLSIHDDKGRELAVRRVYAPDLFWKMSPPPNDHDAFIMMNVNSASFGPLDAEKGWAAQIGVSYDPDTEPFVVIPLEYARDMRRGDTIGFGPGALRIVSRNLKPYEPCDPEPEPLEPERSIRYRTMMQSLLERLFGHAR